LVATDFELPGLMGARSRPRGDRSGGGDDAARHGDQPR